MLQNCYHNDYFSKIRKGDVIVLDAADSEICRFDWSERDQANLESVISEIEKLYVKARSKVPLSQTTRDLKVGNADESTGEDLGSSSSAKTQNPKAAGSKKPPGDSRGSSSSAKTQNPKASVPKSPWDEEFEFHPAFPGKSA